MSKGKADIYVCSKGKKCCKRGGGDNAEAIRAAVKRLGLGHRVKVHEEKCLSLCSTGPTVIVNPGGYQYGSVTPDDCIDLVKSHACDEEPLDRLLLNHKSDKKKD